jgi:hypothetical protein
VDERHPAPRLRKSTSHGRSFVRSSARSLRILITLAERLPIHLNERIWTCTAECPPAA